MSKQTLNLLHHIIFIKCDNYCIYAYVSKDKNNYIYCDVLRRDNYEDGAAEFVYIGGLNDTIIKSLIDNELESKRNSYYIRARKGIKTYTNFKISKNKLSIHNKNKLVIN